MFFSSLKMYESFEKIKLKIKNFSESYVFRIKIVMVAKQYQIVIILEIFFAEFFNQTFLRANTMQ
jgi:hypothetical protein